MYSNYTRGPKVTIPPLFHLLWVISPSTLFPNVAPTLPTQFLFSYHFLCNFSSFVLLNVAPEPCHNLPVANFRSAIPFFFNISVISSFMIVFVFAVE